MGFDVYLKKRMIKFQEREYYARRSGTHLGYVILKQWCIISQIIFSNPGGLRQISAFYISINF